MHHLDVTCTDGPDGPLLVARGQLDMATAERLESAILEAEARAPAVLTIDYSGLEFLDSTGLQLLLDADVRANRDGRRLVVVLGDGEARRVAALADVAARLDVAELER